MFLKKTAGKTLPTVVYPELYRKRFCEAMDKYFTVVPDKWTGLGADVKYKHCINYKIIIIMCDMSPS